MNFGKLHEFWKAAPAKRSPDNRLFGIVSLVDMLGFSSESWEISASELQRKLEFSLNYCRSASENPIPMGSPPRQFVKFQDTMIRCTEIGYADDEEIMTAKHMAKWLFAISDELASLRDIQLNFIGEEVPPLRGAVAIGYYDIVNGVVFGPALLRVIEMEKNEAKFPRIILDFTVSGFIDFIPPENNKWFELNLQTDEDGIIFIDYLKGAAFETPWDLWWYAKALEKHKFRLDRLASKPSKDIRAAEKLRWLINYHNKTVKYLSTAAPRRWELDWDSFLVTSF